MADETLHSVSIDFGVTGAGRMTAVLEDYTGRIEEASEAERRRAESLAEMRRVEAGVAPASVPLGGYEPRTGEVPDMAAGRAAALGRLRERLGAEGEDSAATRREATPTPETRAVVNVNDRPHGALAPRGEHAAAERVARTERILRDERTATERSLTDRTLRDERTASERSTTNTGGATTDRTATTTTTSAASTASEEIRGAVATTASAERAVLVERAAVIGREREVAERQIQAVREREKLATKELDRGQAGRREVHQAATTTTVPSVLGVVSPVPGPPLTPGAPPTPVVLQSPVHPPTPAIPSVVPTPVPTQPPASARPRRRAPANQTPGVPPALRGAGSVGGGGAGGGGGSPGSVGPGSRGDALAAALERNTLATAANTRAMNLARNAGPVPRPPGFRDGEAENKKGFDVGGTTGSAFGAGVGGILGSVAASDSSLFSTLTASLKMLAGEIGEVFSPAVEGAARALQSWAGWFDSLDAGWKKTIGTVGVWTVAIAGATFATSRLWGAGKLAWTAVAGLGRTMLFTPWGLAATAIGGIAAGVTYLTGNWNNLTGAVTGAVGAMQDVAGINFGKEPEGRRKQQTFHDLTQQLSSEVRKSITTTDKPEAVPDRIAAAIAKQEKVLAEQRQNQVGPLLEERGTADRRTAILQSKLPTLQKEYEKQLEDYNAKYRRPDNALKELPHDNNWYTQQFFKLKEQLRMEAINEAHQAGIPGGMLREEAGHLYTASPDGFVQRPKVDDVMPRDNRSARISESIKSAEKELATLRQLEKVTQGEGGQKDFLQNVKLPPARMTSFEEYSQSLQLKILDGNSVDTVNAVKDLQRALERLGERILTDTSSVGDVASTVRALTSIFRGN